MSKIGSLQARMWWVPTSCVAIVSVVIIYQLVPVLPSLCMIGRYVQKTILQETPNNDWERHFSASHPQFWYSLAPLQGAPSLDRRSQTAGALSWERGCLDHPRPEQGYRKKERKWEHGINLLAELLEWSRDDADAHIRHKCLSKTENWVIQTSKLS